MPSAMASPPGKAKHKSASAPTSPHNALAAVQPMPTTTLMTKSSRLIAFAVNNSKETLAAFQWATANLVRGSDKVILVHVHDRMSKESGLKLLQTFADKCARRSLEYQSVNVQNSNAASAIAQVCRSYPVDLCVMGSRGFGPIRRALMGSVSSSTAQQSDCPVMVIKRPKDAAGAYLQVLPRRVFFHMDGSQQSRRAFIWAEQYLLQSDLDEVYLVHICKLSVKFSQNDELERVQAEQLLDTCEKRLRAKGIQKIIKVRETGPSTETLLRVCTENSCDVLVAGLGDGKPVFGECLAMYSLHNAPFPVVVVGLDRRRRDQTANMSLSLHVNAATRSGPSFRHSAQEFDNLLAGTGPSRAQEKPTGQQYDYTLKKSVFSPPEPRPRNKLSPSRRPQQTGSKLPLQIPPSPEGREEPLDLPLPAGHAQVLKRGAASPTRGSPGGSSPVEGSSSRSGKSSLMSCLRPSSSSPDASFHQEAQPESREEAKNHELRTINNNHAAVTPDKIVTSTNSADRAAASVPRDRDKPLLVPDDKYVDRLLEFGATSPQRPEAMPPVMATLSLEGIAPTDSSKRSSPRSQAETVTSTPKCDAKGDKEFPLGATRMPSAQSCASQRRASMGSPRQGNSTHSSGSPIRNRLMSLKAEGTAAMMKSNSVEQALAELDKMTENDLEAMLSRSRRYSPHGSGTFSTSNRDGSEKELKELGRKVLGFAEDVELERPRGREPRRGGMRKSSSGGGGKEKGPEGKDAGPQPDEEKKCSPVDMTDACTLSGSSMETESGPDEKFNNMSFEEVFKNLLQEDDPDEQQQGSGGVLSSMVRSRSLALDLQWLFSEDNQALSLSPPDKTASFDGAEFVRTCMYVGSSESRLDKASTKGKLLLPEKPEVKRFSFDLSPERFNKARKINAQAWSSLTSVYDDCALHDAEGTGTALCGMSMVRSTSLPELSTLVDVV